MVEYGSFGSDTQSCAQDNPSRDIFSATSEVQFKADLSKGAGIQSGLCSEQIVLRLIQGLFYIKLHDIYLAILNLRRIEHTIRSLPAGYWIGSVARSRELWGSILVPCELLGPDRPCTPTIGWV